MIRVAVSLTVALAAASSALSDVTLNQALEVLRGRENAVSSAKLAEAKAAVRAECPAGGKQCIEKLMEVWSSDQFSHPASIELACELADASTAQIVFDAVAEKAARQDGHWPYRVDHFFYRLGPAFWQKLGRPDKFILLALEAGRTIGHLPMNAAERDWFAFGQIRSRTDAVTDASDLSWAGVLSADAMPELLRFAQAEVDYARANPHVRSSERLHIAVDTLVARSHPEALPLVKSLLEALADDDSNTAIRKKWQRAVLKLQFQNDPNHLLEIARTERHDVRRLQWATWRYLLAGGSLSRLHAALKENRVFLEEGPRAGSYMTDTLLFVIFGEGESSWTRPDGVTVRRIPDVLSSPLDLSLLDGTQLEEFLQRREQVHLSGKKEELEAFRDDFDYGSVLKRASP